MQRKIISLKKAAEFHGHLGPYLVLGLRAGELALKKLGCRKHFGLKVKVYGALKKPRSCLIDGLQLSSGATFGKGNIFKLKGSQIKLEVINLKDNSRAVLGLLKPVQELLMLAETRWHSQILAKKLYRIKPENLFSLRIFKD